MRILILYRELAAYLVPTLEDVVKRFNAQITLVVYEINSEAPFVFSPIEGVNVVCKLDFINEQFGYDFDLVFCSGWADKEYLRIIKHQKNKTVKVICFDSEWRLQWRKIMGLIYLRLTVTNKFDYAFVPGKSSCRFAKFMGFSSKQILFGVYSADVDKFSRLRNEVLSFGGRPKRFLFVGRYVKEKGNHDVCEAFIKFCEVSNENWELWCVGTGPEKINCIKHPKIKHLGFLQPDELVGILGDVDVFVMPSHSEPWGVVLHEMVLAGLPVLVSDSVNSRELFLADGINGLEFKAQSADDLLAKMIQISDMYRKNRQTMILKSRELGSLISNNNWSLLIDRVIE